MNRHPDAIAATVACTCERGGAVHWERHGTDCAKWLAGFFPGGRVFYDETGDQAAFIEQIVALGFHVAVHHAPDLEPWATVDVPAERLGEFYALDLRVGT